MTNDLWAGLPDLLSRLEDLELPLLSWGVVDGFLSEAEVRRSINDQLDEDVRNRPLGPWPTEDEYLSQLIASGLLHQIPGDEANYRTRIAETLRLLKMLRQLLPRDVNVPAWWRKAPALVADYRLRVAPRWYPERTVDQASLEAKLGDLPTWSDESGDVLGRIVGDRRLAAFQARATESILAALSQQGTAGRIITAGTGSGKTLAFYLPALIDIARRADEQRNGPHTLALYPRNELLRDQARETLRLIHDVGPLKGPGRRRGRIAMLYGNTPFEKDFDRGTKPFKGWRREANGWATPYFPCLSDGCESSLVWSDSDRTAGIEALGCPRCGFKTEPDTISLTRESIRANQPDILFSSTEMLSRQATNTHFAGVLGWKGPNGTRLVLLDEVHTYSGVHGAQVALTLRRWFNANTRPQQNQPVFVGLSATLRDAGDFFATLTGLDRAKVEVISPLKSDLRPTSREYGVVLRGDPLSGAALLSTSIQTLMLLGRVLDDQPSMFGSVGFAFTDDLDVINRLYDNLRDAEGLDPRGMARGEVLADLRSPAGPQASARYPDGQSWDLPDKLGRMGRSLRIARTSSQDAGVDSSADLIVATASLEVGFNDPRVGAVIQHKAPRDMASFLQRRGRAGRYLAMRPITAVVLSDYGRDRIAYQSYEQLLEPEIGARSLPVANRFVVKIQATHAMIDWIMRKLGGLDARWVLQPPYRGNLHNQTPRVAQLLAALLENSNLQAELGRHLERALGIQPDEATAAMWEEPRSLMLSVVPTALRRLETSWTPLPGEVDPGAEGGDPLPEFMTRALFEPLNTPDVQFNLPFTGAEPETMGVAQALREAVPGRVSRRFGYGHVSHSSWLPVPPPGSDLELTQIVSKGHGLGTWTTSSGEDYLVVRPLVLELSSPPPGVAPTSSAVPIWRSAFLYEPVALRQVDIPTPSLWSELITGFGFALHVAGGALRVRRMTVGSDGELLERQGGRATRRPVSVRYSHQGGAAALGYELDADGLVIEGLLPQDRADLYRAVPRSKEWRTLAFRQRVREDDRLDGVANVFQRDWLVEIYRNAHVAYGLRNEVVDGAPEALEEGRWAADIDDFFAAAYRADAHEVGEVRLLAALKDLVAVPLVRTVVEEHGRLLTTRDLSTTTQDLLDRVFVDSLASAILTAVQEALPDAQETDLAVDIELGVGESGANDGERAFRIIVTETSIGGLGLLEALHRDYVLDPRQFWEGVERACEPTEAEDVDRAMQRLAAELVRPNSDLAAAAGDFRAARSIADKGSSLDRIIREWTLLEGPPSHLLVSTFSARMLRPGSKPEIDKVVDGLVREWLRQEERLGVEIDARTLVHLASEGVLACGLGSLTPDMAFSMLWLRGAQARGQRLQHYHPFRDNVVVERLVVAQMLNVARVEVDIRDRDWIPQYVETLEAEGSVTLTAPYGERSAFAAAMREVVATPVERMGLRVFGRVTAVIQRDGFLLARVSIAEELQ